MLTFDLTFEEVKRRLEDAAQNPRNDYDQFTIDWAEEKRDHFDMMERLEDFDSQIVLEALRYEIENILEVMKDDAKGRPFFEGVLRAE